MMRGPEEIRVKQLLTFAVLLVCAGSAAAQTTPTALDALKTKRKGQPGTEVAELISEVYNPGSPQQLRIVFKRGQIDPLALLTFKVLPGNRPEDLVFARKPVGTGPFVYGGRQVQGGREYALFPANPAYGKRADRPNLPRLKAVWMVASRNPVAYRRRTARAALSTVAPSPRVPSLRVPSLRVPSLQSREGAGSSDTPCSTCPTCVRSATLRA